MGDDSSFPELVCFYLPSAEWIHGDTLNNSAHKRHEHGPETSIFDRYHYRLLQTYPNCDSVQLEHAFEEWLRIGEYENGESQRKYLATYFMRWGRQRELFFAIQKGLNGNQEERDAFTKEREAEAKVEAKEDKTWKMWLDVSDLFEESDEIPYPPARDPRLYMQPALTADDLLGRHLWPRRMLERNGKVARDSKCSAIRRSQRQRKH